MSEEQKQEAPKLTALERMQRVEASLEKFERYLQSVAQPMFQHFGTEIEQSKNTMAGVVKTLSAIVAELSDNKAIDLNNIMVRIRRIDEENDKKEVENYLKSKVIQAVESITAVSLVTVKVELKKEDGKVDLLSDFVKFDLNAVKEDEPTKIAMLGKKVGEVVEVAKDKDFMIYTILGIYELAPQQVPEFSSAEAAAAVVKAEEVK